MNRKRRTAMLLQWVCTLMRAGKAIPVTYDQIRSDRPGCWTSQNWRRDIARDLDDLRDAGFIQTARTHTGVVFAPGDFCPTIPSSVSLLPDSVSLYPNPVSLLPGFVSNSQILERQPPSSSLSSPLPPSLSLSPTPPLSIPSPITPSLSSSTGSQVEEGEGDKEGNQTNLAVGHIDTSISPGSNSKSAEATKEPIGKGNPPVCAPPPRKPAKTQAPTIEEVIKAATEMCDPGKFIPASELPEVLKDAEFFWNHPERYEKTRSWWFALKSFLVGKVQLRAKWSTEARPGTVSGTRQTPPSAVFTLGSNQNASQGLPMVKKPHIGQLLSSRKRLEGEVAALEKQFRDDPFTVGLDFEAMKRPGAKDAYERTKRLLDATKADLKAVNIQLEESN